MASELMDIFYIFIPILLLLSFCIYVHNQRKKTILTLEYLVKVLPAKIMITLVLHFCLNVNSNYQESNRTKKTLQCINAAWMERILFMQKLTLYFLEFMEIIL